MDYIRNNSLRKFNLTRRFWLPTLRSHGQGEIQDFGLFRRNLVTKYMLLNFTSLSKPFSSPFFLFLSPSFFCILPICKKSKKVPPVSNTLPFIQYGFGSSGMFLDLDFKFKTSFKILLNPKLPSQLPKVNKSFFPYFISLAPSYKLSRKPIICRQIHLGGGRLLSSVQEDQ